MEHLPHGDLHKYMSGSEPLVESQAQTIAYQLLEGLDFLHENGFAHRDLKPSNVLIKSRPPEPWWIKIGDFGISKRVEDSTGGASAVRGTLGFMSPEIHGFINQADCLHDGSAAAQAMDVWSLGEIIFQILTKQASFPNMARLSDFVRDPDLFPSTILQQRAISQTCVDLLQSMLRPSPIRRIRVEEALLHPWAAVLRIQTHKAPSVASLSSSETDTESQLIDTFEHSDPSAAWTTMSQTSDIQKNTTRPISVSSHLAETIVQRSQLPNFPQSTVTTRASNSDRSVFGNLPNTGPEIVESVQPQHEGSREETRSTYDNQLTVHEKPHPAEPMIDRQVKNSEATHQPTFSTTVVAFSHNGSVLAVKGPDCVIELRSLRGHTGPVSDIAFSPNGQLLASASYDSTIRLWQADTGTQVQLLKGHKHAVRTIAFSSDGLLLASAGWDSTVRLWRLGMGPGRILQFHPGYQLQTLEGSHVHDVKKLAFSPLGVLLTASSVQISLWQMKKYENVSKLETIVFAGTMLMPSPDGSLLAITSGLRLSVRVEETGTGREVQRFQVNLHAPISAVVISLDNSLLAFSTRRGQLQIFKIRTGQQVQAFGLLIGGITNTLAITSDNLLIGWGTDNGRIGVHNVSTGFGVWAASV